MTRKTKRSKRSKRSSRSRKTKTVASQQKKRLVLARTSNRIAIDVLQVSNYVQSGKVSQAVKNAQAVIKSLGRLYYELKGYR